MPSSSSTTSRFRSPPLTSTRIAVAKPISLGAIKILKSSCRMFRYGARFLPFGIGVDRHLGNLASTNCRDEVDSHDPAPFRQELLGVWCDVDVHGESPNPKDVRGGNPPNVTHSSSKLASDFSRTRRLWPAVSGERTVSGGNRWSGPAAGCAPTEVWPIRSSNADDGGHLWCDRVHG